VALLLATASLLAIGGIPPAHARASDPACDLSQPACEPPECWYDTIHARPGLARDYRIWCHRMDSAKLAAPPKHGQLTDLRYGAGGDVRWRYRPDDDAPADDFFVLAIDGPTGTLQHRVRVVVTPRDVNTPPRCDPVEVAERTTGLVPPDLHLFVACYDEEHDAMTIEGGGPGTHAEPVHKPSEPTGGNTGWSYRPVTKDGEESTTYWATDDVGARSADAPISVKVGPGVDRLPTCGPNPWFGSYERLPVFARAGAVRRFGMICEDPDGDPMAPVLTDPPERGVMTTVPGEPTVRWNGALETWVDATYVPTPGIDAADDPFGVTPKGPRGDGPEARMEIVLRDESSNGGGSCGWSGSAVTAPGVPTTVWASCSDNEGDAFTAEVVQPPRHGVVTPPVVTRGRYGFDDITLAYQPAPGFTGWDCVEVRVVDRFGEGFTLMFDLIVREPEAPVGVPPVEVPPVEPPEVELPTGGTGPVVLPPPGARGAPSLLTTSTGPRAPAFTAPAAAPQPAAPPVATRRPSAGQAPPVAPAEQARRALRARGVRLVRTIGDARIYAARNGRRAVAISCPVACTVSARADRATAAALRRVTVTPGRAKVLSVPRAGLRISLSDARGPAGRATIRLR
jgi:hypothetical protein